MKVLRLLVWSLLIMLIACSGGDGGDDGVVGSGFTLIGVAAEGAPIAKATVELKDNNGAKLIRETEEDGSFEFDLTGLQSPFLLRVRSKNRFLFGFAQRPAAADVTIVVSNIHPLTDITSRNWFRSRGRDIDGEFVDDDAIDSPPDEATIGAIASQLTQLVSVLLNDFNVEVSFNIFTSPFIADSKGFDGALDRIKTEVDENQAGIKIIEPNTEIESNMLAGFPLQRDFAEIDETPPDTPAGLAVLPAGPDRLVLAWNASFDEKGVSGYNIYRNDELLAPSPYPVYTHSGLQFLSEYCYQVEAFDGSGNSSPKSEPQCGITLQEADATPPPPPLNLQAASAPESSIVLTWLPPEDEAVLAYQVYRRINDAEAEKIATVVETTYTDKQLPDGFYCYTIRAIDAALNSSEPSNEACYAVMNEFPVSSEGLLLYMPFNGNADDLSGYGHHGTVTGALLTEDRFGNADSAYLFDGVDDEIIIDNTTRLKPPLPVTISAWALLNGPGSALFLNDRNGNGVDGPGTNDDSYKGVWIAISPTGLSVSFGCGGTGIEGRHSKISQQTVEQGVWHHVVGVMRGPLDMDLYLNGDSIGEYNYRAGFSPNAPCYDQQDSGTIGRLDSTSAGPPIYFDGKVDDILFFQRSLSAVEVQALFQAQ